MAATVWHFITALVTRVIKGEKCLLVNAAMVFGLRDELNMKSDGRTKTESFQCRNN